MRGPSEGARLALVSMLASLLIGATLCGLLLAGIGMERPALAAPLVIPAPSTTVTATATASATPQPSPAAQASFTLVSPSMQQGPVGAQLTFAGDHWSGSQVTIAAATTSCSSPAGTLGATALTPHGSFVVTLAWPTALASYGTAYLLCATSDADPAVTAPQTYRVRAGAPPSLSLTLPQAAVGQEVQIQGVNFDGASRVTLTLQTPRGTRALPSALPDPKDGSFIASYTPASGDIGAVTIAASSVPDGSAPPALNASVSLAVGPPLPPRATPTPLVAQAETSDIIIASNDASTDSPAPLVLLAVGMLLLLLALIGLMAVLILRPQPVPQPAVRLSSARLAASRRETARASLGATERANGLHQPSRSGAPLDYSDRSDAAPDWQQRQTTGLLRSYAAGAYDRFTGDDAPGGLGARWADQSDDDADGALGDVDNGPNEDDQPTMPSSQGYLGLPTLDTSDPDATRPKGRPFRKTLE